ncbi:FeoA domain-containing protein [Cellulomonas sp. ATA003]|uniref:FeoA domain-containing protein n=1 Tax=Cellulomonas sp. ATA003 TaxID=3073064 RepID=UPI002873D738|nr:FeoA domain-containing protein [Cellulomonas sp. ATA003]WNB87527.1 FeoA domain-containing protein [Cellulomonas sp. ATA003]
MVARISDADPGLLRHFAAMGLGVDAEVDVVVGADGVRTARLAGLARPLDDGATAALWLVPPTP